MRRLSDPAQLALRVTLVVGLVFAIALGAGLVKPIDLIVAGTDDPSVPIVQKDFGTVPDQAPRDGVQFYVVAHFFPHVKEATPYLQPARYRIQRILLPAIASVAPNGAPTVIAMLLVNLVGIGLGSFGMARLFKRRGYDYRLAYSVAAGCFLSLASSHSEPLAFGLLFLGIDYLDQKDYLKTAIVFTLAGLTREAVVVPVLAVWAIEWWKAKGWEPIVGAISSVAIPIAWCAFLAVYIGGHSEPLGSFGKMLAGPNEVLFKSLIPALLFSGLAVYHWRRIPMYSVVALIFTLWIFVYPPNAYAAPDSVIRLSAASLTLGFAALADVIIGRLHSSNSNDFTPSGT